jgi:two-component system response regulator
VDNDLKPVHILLVEDNPHDVEITKRALDKGQLRNRLTVARDGQEALDILEELRDRPGDLPGLILLDLNLPRVNGIEVLQVIKGDREFRRIPVIVLTTSTREGDVVKTYELGVNTFISKPVRFEDFIRVVTTIHEYWILIATLPSRVRV